MPGWLSLWAEQEQWHHAHWCHKGPEGKSCPRDPDSLRDLALLETGGKESMEILKEGTADLLSQNPIEIYGAKKVVRDEFLAKTHESPH